MNLENEIKRLQRIVLFDRLLLFLIALNILQLKKEEIKVFMLDVYKFILIILEIL